MDDRVADYAEHVATTPRPGLLDELDATTREEIGHGSMLSGNAVGRLLEMLVWATNAERVLEIGTFTGVSALAMAEGLRDGGRIVSLELDPERAEFARRGIARSPHADRIEVVVGPALESIARLDGAFDVVFIDADKAGYADYVDAVLPKLAPHGVIALDNTLFSGQVLDPPPGSNAEALDALNRRLSARDDVVAVTLTVRDGVTLVRKRA